MASPSISIILLAALAALSIQLTAAVVEHIVGVNSEWKIESYESWLSGKTFRVGDTLRFNFVSDTHDVVEVTDADYSSCTATSPIKSYGLQSPVTVSLNKTGDYQFICGFPDHCSGGMKIKVNVLAASTTPPASGGTPASVPAPQTPANPGSGAESPAFGAWLAAGGFILLSVL